MLKDWKGFKTSISKTKLSSWSFTPFQAQASSISTLANQLQYIHFMPLDLIKKHTDSKMGVTLLSPYH